MRDGNAPDRHVAFLLPGRARQPVGGYKVVLEYANELARRGDRVILVYSPGYLAESGGWRASPSVRAKHAASRLLAALPDSWRRPWMEIDPRVTEIDSLRPPPVPVGPGDVVVATAVQTMPHAVRIAEATGARGVALIQGYETWSSSAAFVEAAWRLPLVRIVVSPWLAEKGRELGVETHLLTVPVRADAFPLGMPISQRPLRVLTMLSAQPSKRMDLALEVFEALPGRFPGVQGAAFGVGPRPSGLARYVEYARSPRPDELRRLYQEARVYFSSSDSEGWGLPATEATMAGAAIVSAENGGTRSALGDFALYAPLGRADLLTDLVVSVLEDAGSAQTRATAARDVLMTHTFEDAAERLSQLLEQTDA